jgi:hypothetical protein
MSRVDYDRNSAISAIMRLSVRNKALSKETFSSTLGLKPINISNGRWWAMLNQIKIEYRQ